MDKAALWAFTDWLKARPSMAGLTVISGPLPDGGNAPEHCVGVMDYPGPPVANWQADYRVQIRCRSIRPGGATSPYNDGKDIADAVIAAVAPAQDGRVIATVGERRMIVILRSGPLSLGSDSAGRWEFSINVALEGSRV